MTKRNPKQEGSNLWDCKTQVGNCPMNCNQCFANRPGAVYIPMDEQILPSPEEVGDGIVRANCLHDSNFGREELVEHCKQYKKVFYNTSIPKFDFPGPVVFTANAKEEEIGWFLPDASTPVPDNLMFVRLRVSASNLRLIDEQVSYWARTLRVPVVLTFMAYYDQEPPGCIHMDDPGTTVQLFFIRDEQGKDVLAYTWKKRHINSYYCATAEFMAYVIKRMKKIAGRLVTICGTLDSNYCRDCRNCEVYYYQIIKHVKEI